MLLNLNKQSWMDSLQLEKYSMHCQNNEKSVEQMLKLAKLYKKVMLTVYSSNNKLRRWKTKRR